MVTFATLRSVNVRRGDILGGRYRIEGVVGAGSMGLVLCAHQLDLDRRVAVKVLLPEAVEEESVERLRREGRALSRLTTSHVSRLLDIGELDSSGTPFIVMELLEGQDLSKLLREHGPLPIDTVVRLALQTCEALTEAHEAGIIHRDIKPSNLFLANTAGGMTELKVLDFGISKITSNGAGGGRASSVNEKALTGASQLLGSPVYMSPEQVRASRDVDARTDVWSLGVVLHELLCGQRPFNGKTIPDVCVRILHAAPPSLTTLRPDIPEELAAVVLRCLEKDPSRRYASIAELADAIAPFVDVPSHNPGPVVVGDVATRVVSAPNNEMVATIDDPDLVTTASAWWRKRILDQARRRRHGAIAIASIATIGALSFVWPNDEGLAASPPAATTTTTMTTAGFGLVSASAATPIPTVSALALPRSADRVTLESSPRNQRLTHEPQRVVVASAPKTNPVFLLPGWAAPIATASPRVAASSPSPTVVAVPWAPKVAARDPGY